MRPRRQIAIYQGLRHVRKFAALIDGHIILEAVYRDCKTLAKINVYYNKQAITIPTEMFDALVESNSEGGVANLIKLTIKEHKS